MNPTTDDNAPIWSPSPEQVANSNLWRFIGYVNQQHGLSLNDYPSLYQWSTEHPQQFWPAVWRFCNIKAANPWVSVLQDGNTMPGAKWFQGAKLNFAENLLSRQDEQPALIFKNEDRLAYTLSYGKLYQKVAQLAGAMRNHGIQPGDRIAGFMPNIPETVIAMLATASIGAIWSSCSPDFGTNGAIERFGQITPRLLFCCDGYYFKGKGFDTLQRVGEIATQIPSLEKVILVPYLNDLPSYDQLPNATLFADFLSDEQVIHFTQFPFDHPLYILYSSGTTGKPKCIVHSAGGTLIQHLKELVLHSDLKPEERIFYFTTCGWMMWNWLVSSLAVGATVMLYDGSPFHPTPEVLFDYAQQYEMNLFGTSAKYLSALEKSGAIPAQSHQLASLRMILSTGSPLLPESYDYVYQHIKPDIHLASISGGTDIVSCFALGNPIQPVYRGELQCRGLGMKVAIYDEQGKTLRNQPGELVCEAPTPSMPIYFWDDESGEHYRNAYFSRFPGVWAHGDFAELTQHDGLIIYGRSDAVLNPGGVRIGTAEIYRQVEKLPEVLESIAVGQDWQGDVRVILFLKLRDGIQLDDTLIQQIKKQIRDNTTPRHVPAKILQVTDIPRTISGKIVELAVRNVIHNRPVSNTEALANPEVLEQFKNRRELAS